MSTRARLALAVCLVLCAPGVRADVCPDADLDGYANCTVPGCSPSGLLCGDCNDADGAVHPGAAEACNHRDDDCDGRVDEGFAANPAQRKLLDPGRQTSDAFGRAIAVIGDVTGDGVADIVVGIPNDDVNGTTDAGSALVFNGATRQVVCRLIDTAPNNYDGFGYSVGGVGDVTGDGTPDIVVGAYLDDTAQGTDAGSASVFSGANCGFVRRLTDTGGASYDRLGTRVAGLPDLTGDGTPEIAAGAYLDDAGSVGNAGSVALFDGATGALLRKLTDPSGAAEDQLGLAIVGLPDITGDATPDVAVSAHLDDTTATDTGSVLVFSGADGAFVRKFSDSGALASDQLGTALVLIADVSGDGTPDLAAGAWYDDTTGGANAGSVVLFNPVTGATIRKLIDPLGLGDDRFGAALAALGDVNGDGTPDLLVGADRDDTSAGANAGSLIVISCGDGAVLERYTDSDGAANDLFGTAVAAGDVTGDGVVDYLAGALEDDTPEAANGGSLVIVSNASDCDGDGRNPLAGDCNDADAARYEGAVETCDTKDNDCDGAVDEDNDADGYAVCVECNDADPRVHPGAAERCNAADDDCDGSIDEGPDADADGYAAPCDCRDDLAAVHPGASEACNHLDDDCDGAIDEGTSVPGASVPLPDAGAAAGDSFGYALAVVGDVTGDGRPDLVVGAPNDNTAGKTDNGSAVLYNGRTRAPICRMLDTAPANYDYLGVSVAGIGDVTGDGIPDIAAGAHYDDTTQGTDAGSVVIFSGADCAFVRKLTDPASTSYDKLGTAVAGIGDVTGDGTPDIAAGAPHDAVAGETQAGSVTVFDGAGGAVVYRVTDVSPNAYDYFGSSLATLGDVDRDGTPDFLVGAYADDIAAGSDAGSVSVISGRTGVLIRKLIDPGAAANDQLGYAIARVPDMTGDGIDDVAAGAYLDDTTQGSDAGSVVLFNAATGAMIRKLSDTASLAGDRLGRGVAAMPDVNGDGTPDIVAGAYYDDTAVGTDAGSLVVFSGSDGSVIRRFTDPAGAASDHFGAPVIALDVDGDGVAEIIAGAPDDDTALGIDAGNATLFVQQSDCDADGLTQAAGDCDDGRATVYTGAVELCDGRDNDCDATVDEDGDADGYAACADCNNGDARIRPGAIERCNALDDDCDGSTDEGPDADGDGYAAPCDCRDDLAAAHPGASETCNHVDDDCDGAVDEGAGVASVATAVPDGGASVGDGFAYAMAVVGDVTGDGRPDYVIGVATDNTSGKTDNGSAVLYDGRTREPRCRMVDTAPGNYDYLGVSVAALGDVTGDGIPDIVAGAHYDDTTQGTDAGSAVIFSGADCTMVRKLSDPASTSYDHVGVSVAGIGDVTGDGIPEVAAGATADDVSGETSAGSVSVFDGASGAVVYRVVDPAPNAYDYFGSALAALGDVDRDGWPDFAVAAYARDALGGSDSGAVSVISGRTGALIRKLADPGGAANDQCGRSLTRVPDMTNDGIDEIAAGAPYDDTAQGSDAGSVVIWNGATGAFIRKLTDTAGLAGDRLGWGLAAMPDVNGDGTPDLVAGANYDDTAAGTDAGSLVVFSGADGSVLRRFVDPAGATSDHFGTSVLAYDADGDGLAEIIGGTPDDDTVNGLDAGSATFFVQQADCDADGFTPAAGDCDDSRATVYSGAVELCDGRDNDCDATLEEDTDGDGYGACADCNNGDARIRPGAAERCNALDDDCDGSIDEGPDADADGIAAPCDCRDDLAAVHPGASESCNHLDDDCDGAIDEGTAVAGGSAPIQDPGTSVSDGFSYSMAVVGDVTGDGRPDFAVGLPYDNNSARTNNGSAVLYDGRTRVPRCRMFDNAPGNYDYLGVSVAALGDVTGDGIPDIAVGEHYDDTAQGTDAGSVVIFSGADCALVRKLSDPASTSYDHLGSSVAGIGDVTGDGLPEVAAGAIADDAGGESSGGSVTVFNGATGAVVYRVTDGGPMSYDYFGSALAALGDVDRDGWPDFAVAAYARDSIGGSDAGAVSVISGRTGALIRKLADPGGAANDQLGRSLARIPDMTNDGIDEIAAGAPYDDTAQGADAGSVVIWNGATGALIRKLSDTASLAADRLGSSVAGMPDVNGDGTPDIVAGASYDDTAAGADAGSLVVFSGADGSVLRRFTDPLGAASDHMGATVLAYDADGDGLAEIIGGAPDDDTANGIDAGSATFFVQQADCDGDGRAPAAGDCDDSRATVYLGAVELCDGRDNDCDATLEEDGDGDGYGACSDCNNGDARIRPGAAERCNAADDDCDGSIDEGPDGDADGYAAPCDCRDDLAAVHPGATETCNHQDDDCDGAFDEPSAGVTFSAKLTDATPANSASFGTALAALGDTNRDGIADAAIGVPNDDSASRTDNGAVVLLDGRTRTIRCRMADPAPGNYDYLGVSVAAIGDVTGDGVSDVAAGASYDDTTQGTDAGSVLIFSGANCAFVRKLADPASTAYDHLGSAVAGVGDVTGDGIPDIAAGATSDDVGGETSAGSISVFDGLTGAVVYRIVDAGPVSYDYLGSALSGLGDVNGDGWPDIAAAAYARDSLGGSDAGAISVFSGRTGALIRKLADPGGAANDQLGRSLARVPDLTGDGIAEIAAGAPYDDTTQGTDAGSVVLWDGATGAFLRKFTDAASLAGDRVGWSLAALPDINGDGTPDLAAGAHYDDTAQGADTGSVVVFSGADGSVLSRFTDPAGAASDHLGSALAALDLTGDGLADLLAAAVDDDEASKTDAGSVLVFAVEPDCDGDGYTRPGGDCDDAFATVFPGNPEVCDSLDNDCNGLIDDGMAISLEVCNGLDENCNGLIDEGNPGGGGACATGLPGACNAGTQQCSGGALACVATLGPGPEACNGIDDDCDGTVDETTDSDGDGVGNCSDNCPDAQNPGQQDGDGDHVGDVCDCTPADPANPPPPAPGPTLILAGSTETTLGWAPVAGVTQYNVYRGFAILGRPWDYNHQCFANKLETTGATDAQHPRPAAMFYYLVSSVCGSNSESAPGTASSGTSIPRPFHCPDPLRDTDGDGVEEALDNCPGFRNDSQSDADADSHGDVCDNCPAAANTDQLDTDGDHLGNACDPDDDGDGVTDASDNCPLVANPDQADLDGDHLGNACDPDRDGDGVNNGTDNCPDVSNPGQQDGDRDGIGDACDPTP